MFARTMRNSPEKHNHVYQYHAGWQCKNFKGGGATYLLSICISLPSHLFNSDIFGTPGVQSLCFNVLFEWATWSELWTSRPKGQAFRDLLCDSRPLRHRPDARHLLEPTNSQVSGHLLRFTNATWATQHGWKILKSRKPIRGAGSWHS